MTERRNYAMRGRIAAVGTAILIAGLLAACGSARAAQPAPVAPGQAAAARDIAAGTGAVPTYGPSSGATNDGPPGQVFGTALPAEVRTSEGGGVTVEATPAGAAGSDLVFSLSLNTHMVDLNYDYRALASLSDDQGNVYPAARWEGGNGGHHLTGKLLFSNPLQSRAGIKWLELEIKDVAGVPVRTFRWDIG